MKTIKSKTPVQLKKGKWTTAASQGGYDVRIRYKDGTEKLLCNGERPYTLAQAQLAADNYRG